VLRAVYFDSIRPSVALSAPMLSLADSASFLWRWQLYGAGPPIEQVWIEVVEHARRHFLAPVFPSPTCTPALPKLRQAIARGCELE
jgi:hypothetical protein